MDEEKSMKRHEHDIEIITGRGTKTIRVPILKAENIGPNMAVDEKQIGEQMHTVLSNRDNGKIAMLANSITSHELKKIMLKVGDKTDLVETMTRDMSSSYAKFGNEVFFNASHIADKFHIIKDLLESCQAVRIRYRQENLRKKRLEYEAHKKIEKQREKECIENNEPYKKKNFFFKEETLSNGDTVLEGLARSRYLLFKYRSDWTLSQEKRAKALFEKFPEIEKVHDLANEFRDWMKKSNVGKDMHIIKKDLNKWFDRVVKEDIDEMMNFKSMVERNKRVILNYFIFGATNAIAENINSRIQRFIMINQGTRDREFFYFRIANYFS